MKITIVTSGQPSSNPRAVKEAIALSKAGHQVIVIYNFWVVWADKGDAQIVKEYPDIKWIRVGGHPDSNKSRFLFTRIRSKIFNLFSKILPQNVFLQQRSIARCYHELKTAALKSKADLYIAHNLGALAPAAKAAKKNSSKYAFDAEDYHRGETTNTFLCQRAKLIEDAYIPGAGYISAASPLIAKKYAALYPATNPVVINNVFSKKHLATGVKKFNHGDVLKLFWFSQTVGADRGLEEAIKAISTINKASVQLTILGNSPKEIKLHFEKIAGANNGNRLIFLNPVQPEEIFAIAQQHHVGLALENAHTPNRNICLTNKIFTYLISGLAIIATDTEAQKDFLHTYTDIGETYPRGDAQSLAEVICRYIEDPGLLLKHRQTALNLASEKMNWETEQNYLLSAVAKLFPVLKSAH
ncbi:MAG: glycosyltransferase family 4 protein [Bacteroidetes bacterium]|nr:glycosyltransferase family 4 protein [Bacteroidota bacterium]